MGPEDLRADGYEASYVSFDSPLMRRMRGEAYGEDIGQHSWVGADDLRADIRRLGLSAESRLLDLGCGPCGPLAFVLASVGCRGSGLELSTAALRVGRMRAGTLGVASLLTLQEGDLNAPLPFKTHSFDAAMSLDVVCHVRDRVKLLHEVARVLSPGSRFLFTDPGVVTGAVSSDEVRRRSIHGYTQFVAPGWNEAMLESAGFRLIETEDRTTSVLKYAGGRLAAIEAHRAELEHALGADRVRDQQGYLASVLELAGRAALSRVMYLGEVEFAARRRAP